MGFSRQESWRGLPRPPPPGESSQPGDRTCVSYVSRTGLPLWPPGKTLAAAAAKSHQSCPTLCEPIDGSPPDSRPWNSPGKNTGVGCHFLLQCMKVKSESEVTRSCPTLHDPMDCSLPGSSIHGIFQARGETP